MTEEAISFEAIQVLRAPGFETGGFEVDELSPGINVVHGPNAAGKTTLAESIEWLCWPAAADERASLVGQASVDGDRWRIDVENGRTNYQCNGQEANGPRLPPVDQRDRYRLSLHDLLQRDTTNQSFAEIIERESAGGYDLAAAADELEYSDTPSSANTKAVQNAKAAIEAVQDARNDVGALRQKEHKRSRLESELEAARAASERAELLAQAIEYARARNEREQAQARVEAFPEGVAQVDGDEIEDVRTLDAQIEEWKTRKAAARDEKTAAREQLDDAALPEEGLPTGCIDRLKELRDDFAAAADKKHSLEGDLSGAKRRREVARKDIPLDLDTEDLVDLDPTSWKTVSKFVRDVEQFTAERHQREELDRLLQNGQRPEPDQETLQRATQSLEAWLAAPPATEPEDDDDAFRIAVVSSISLAAASLLLGLLVHPILFAVLVVAGGILWYGRRVDAQSQEEIDERAPHRQSFMQLGLTPPAAWEEEAVRARLLECYDAIAAQRLAAKRSEWRETLATSEETLARKRQQLEATRRDLRAEFGGVPDATDVELAVTTKRVLGWQTAHEDVVATEQRIEAVETEIEQHRRALQETIRGYADVDIDHPSDATEAIRGLEQREQHRRDAQETLERTTATIREASEKIAALEAQREEIFAELNLDPDERERLATLCDQVEEYATANEALQTVRVRAETKLEELQSRPGFEPALTNRTVGELESQRREAERAAEDIEDIEAQIAEITAAIRQAKADDQVEQALTGRDRALDDLRAQLEADRGAMVGDVLVEHVQETTMETSRPAVFERAREILATITRGRYRLDFDEEDARFRAYDERTQKGLALDELSSGTRVQVLLAVRLAFVEQQEQGVRMPLLLDETLANTDDRRATTVIESMIELARNGRQIFYFTAQGDEVAKWKSALTDAKGVDHELVDLASVRAIEDSIPVPDSEPIELQTPDPPAPDGHDHASYGRALAVEPFRPREGVAAAHLWYVVDDVETLAGLLELGIERWGQLDTALSWGRGTLLEDDDQVARIRANATALDAFVDAWRVGRGKPVDREVLDASGAVSDTFIDEVTALAERVDGDGAQIVAALRDGEVDRFRRGKIEELETYFEANGYIEPRETLDDGQLRVAVIEQLIDAGVARDESNERAAELLSRLEAR